MPEISVVVPLYNEQANIAELYRRLTASLADVADYELVLVNDGSHDATGPLLDTLHAEDRRVVVLHLSRNFGHQAAISAGIDHARGRGVILMDGDLQDPPEVLDQFIQAWRDGNDVVYAVRTRRKEGLVKRLGYALFYRLWRAISELDIPLDSGDFCLMDRRVVQESRRLPERRRFVRGLRAFVGFKQTGIRYERAARAAGQPKYTWRALARLAMDGLLGFGSLPLNCVGYLGLAATAMSVLLAAGLVIAWLTGSSFASPWAVVVLAVVAMSGLQLLSLGVVGEYVRRIFDEAKGRPTYIIGELKRRRIRRRRSQTDGDQPVLPLRRRTSGMPRPAA